MRSFNMYNIYLIFFFFPFSFHIYLKFHFLRSLVLYFILGVYYYLLNSKWHIINIFFFFFLEVSYHKTWVVVDLRNMLSLTRTGKNRFNNILTYSRNFQKKVINLPLNQMCQSIISKYHQKWCLDTDFILAGT